MGLRATRRIFCRLNVHFYVDCTYEEVPSTDVTCYLFSLIVIVIIFKETHHNFPSRISQNASSCANGPSCWPKYIIPALPTCLVSIFLNRPSLSCLQPPSRPWTLWYPCKSCETVSNTLLFSSIICMKPYVTMLLASVNWFELFKQRTLTSIMQWIEKTCWAVFTTITYNHSKSLPSRTFPTYKKCCGKITFKLFKYIYYNEIIIILQLQQILVRRR